LLHKRSRRFPEDNSKLRGMTKYICLLAVVFSCFFFPATARKEANLKFDTLNGIQYCIVRHDARDTAKARLGDIVVAHVTVTADSVKKHKTIMYLVSDSRKNNGIPVPLRTEANVAFGDFKNVLPLLAANDSAIVRVDVNTIYKMYPGLSLPPFLKEGRYISYNIAVKSIVTTEKYVAEQEQMEKDRAKNASRGAAQQAPVDDQLIQEYLAQNNIKAEKTVSGLYYVLHKQGSGDSVQPGEKVVVNYTGKLLSGTVFDSNTDPAKGHVQPLEFTAGAGNVIPGWDEGVLLLQKGSIATFYIPSSLAYGAKGAGTVVPPNSVLIFDIKVLDIKEREAKEEKE
jgi:FKBP-type peptidyl-prolyl cis-trans isomerase FkpA